MGSHMENIKKIPREGTFSFFLFVLFSVLILSMCSSILIFLINSLAECIKC